MRPRRAWWRCFSRTIFIASQDEYLTALAEALRVEYEAIVQAGIILQIDAPDLAMGRHTMYRDRSLEEFEVLAARHIEVLNHALQECAGRSGAHARVLGQLRRSASS